MVGIMDTTYITRSYLETLSSADLLELSDEYGLDIPENLNRRFLIGEILEAVNDEHNSTSLEDLTESTAVVEITELPKTYNETQITIMMRNPVWCFVYWDFRDADFIATTKSSGFLGFVLRVSFFEDQKDVKPSDGFEIPVSNQDREQYILLPATAKCVRIDLVAEFKNIEPECMAVSRVIAMQKGYPDISSASLGREVSPIMKLSGLPELLHSQFINHRQSFS